MLNVHSPSFPNENETYFTLQTFNDKEFVVVYRYKQLTIPSLSFPNEGVTGFTFPTFIDEELVAVYRYKRLINSPSLENKRETNGNKWQIVNQCR